MLADTTEFDAEAAAPARTLGSEIAKTAKLAWPVVLGQLAIVGMNLVDTVIAGRVSSQILAEVAIGSAVWGIALLWLIGTMMAVSPEVSKLRGQNRTELLSDTLTQALYLGALVLLVVLTLIPLAPTLMDKMAVAPSLIPGALEFLHGIAWGAPALTYYICLQKFCEGMGRTKPGLYFSTIGLIALIPLCYLLVNGGFGVPRLLARGAGLATALVMWLNAIGLTLYVLHQFRDLGALRRFSRPDVAHIRSLAAIGVPIAITILLEAGLFYAVLLLISHFGKNWVAAHSVAINVASIAFMMPLGLANAVTVRAGFAHGRGDAAGTRLAGVSGICLCLGTQAVSASIMLLFAVPIANLYLPNEPDVASLAAKLLFLAAIFQFPDGVQAISNGALRGMQDTRVPMVLASVAYWGLGFPLAYYLAFSTRFGPSGLWYGFILGLTAAAVLLTYRFFKLSAQSARLSQ
jgi:multidrug resistance protein, MATE family